MLNKARYFIARAQIVAKEQGIGEVFKRFSQKVSRRLRSVSRMQSQKSEEKLYLQEVYSSYLSVARNETRPEYVEFSDDDLSDVQKQIKLIAFYLPQYHAIPENDEWWGKGFTEWTNVAKAVPQFVGHYQPHLPGELGFYDLRVPEVQYRQVELARKYGISGFCFYYYWFKGKKLLEKPIDQFASDPSIDFPFCLCWANENWTRRWDGLDQDVLIAQDYSEKSDYAFIRDLEVYLRNKRYIRIDGRPLIMVYRAPLLPNPKETANRWRQYCRDNGIGEIYLMAVQTPGFTDPSEIGFDAVVEFPPHGLPPITQLNESLKIVNKGFSGNVFDYREAAARLMEKPVPDYPLFKTVFLSWDNTSRRQNDPLIFNNCTPGAYQTWLSAAAEYTRQHAPQGNKLLFINAWNEWAEGTHLEPDRKFGYAFLQATANVVKKMNHELADDRQSKAKIKVLEGFQRKHDTAVILHLYYPELWDEIASYLDNLSDDFDLFVSIPETVVFQHERISSRFPQALIYDCPNRGRDIAPFIRLFSEISPLGYFYVCKIHTKKSTHRQDGDRWRNELFDELLGSQRKIQDIKDHLAMPNVGIVGPRDNLLSTELFIGGNQSLINELADKLNLIYWGEPFNFVAGSMFWFKPEAISPIGRLRLDESDFPVESGEVDATLAHAMERFLGLLALKQGYQILQTGTFSDKVTRNYQYAFALKQ